MIRKKSSSSCYFLFIFRLPSITSSIPLASIWHQQGPKTEKKNDWKLNWKQARLNRWQEYRAWCMIYYLTWKYNLWCVIIIWLIMQLICTNMGKKEQNLTNKKLPISIRQCKWIKVPHPILFQNPERHMLLLYDNTWNLNWTHR